MGKRVNNEGTITKRADGRWEARVSLPTGGRKCFYGKTQQEVKQRLRQAIKDIDAGLPVVNEKQSVEQYLLTWLDAARHSVKPRTWKYYSDFVRLHIDPVIGHIILSRLTPQQIQLLYSKKLDEGLSPTTVNHLHAVLHKALNSAVRLGLVQRNIADMVDPPRTGHHEMEVLSPQQIQLFLLATVNDALEALYVLAISTGMRQGEILALRWRDIDFEHNALQVRATLQCIGGRLSLAEPKTSGSRRRIALSRSAVRILGQHRLRQEEERSLLGSSWDDTLDLVFPNSVGKPMNPANLMHRSFYPLLKKAELPHIRFHDLRHTAATMLLSQKVNVKVVSEMLGHADVATTMRIYAHVLPHMQDEAVDVMNIMLGGNAES